MAEQTPPVSQTSITETEDVFLSYSRTDKAAALRLREGLLAEGISVFRDEESIRIGDNWMQRLQDTVQGCRAFVLLVGRDGVQQQRWVGAEVEAALSRKFSPHDDKERLPIYPVLLAEAVYDDLPVFLRQIQSADWSWESEALPAGLLAELQGQLSQLVNPAPAVLAGEPYRGLRYFRREDADRFFGRDSEVQEALQKLGYAEAVRPVSEHDAAKSYQDLRYYRWLQIHASSGAGKSSLVRAGLLPKIEQGALWRRTGYADWLILDTMMPGEKPLEMLAEKLAKVFAIPGKGMGEWLEQLSDPEKPKALAHALRSDPVKDRAVLLVVDQFEELFTQSDEHECRQFDRLLATALADTACPFFMITTIRSDFLDRFAYLPELSALYNKIKSDYLLPTISEPGLRALIVTPARLAGLQVDTGLVEAMVRDARGEPGVLPLVESALAELWNDARVHGRQALSKAYYEQHNGVVGMLAKQADALINSLGEKGRGQALDLLLALTRINEGGRHTRRRLSRADAVHEAGGGARGEKVLDVLSGKRVQQLGGGQVSGPLRLVVTDGDDDSGYVELVHEMLVRPGEQKDAEGRAIGYWPTLYAYVFKHRDRDFQKQQLQVDAQRWSERGGLGRWFGLAGWRDRRVFCRLRPRKDGLAGRYLARSRWVAWGQTVLLAGVLGVLAESAWWANKNNLPFGYALIKPLWGTGLYTPLPEMVRIPAGSFVMGCVEGRDDVEGAKCEKREEVYGDSAVPARNVTISRDFGLGKYEVTFMQYDYFVWNQKRVDKSVDFPSAQGWERYSLPVINVSWEDANAYLGWLSRKTGEVYRLPTEAEWEYAARAGSDTAFSWGNEVGENLANCENHWCQDTFDDTAPIGSFVANPFDLHDMHGNVFELVADWFANYPDSVAISDPQGPNTGDYRVIRGGGMSGMSQSLRSANRSNIQPSYHGEFIGFRPAQVYGK